MIRLCTSDDFDTILEIINDAAEAYRNAIPADRWQEPYMSHEYLQAEIDRDVVFWGYEQKSELIGAMGIQDIEDVTLIRHAYVRSSARRQGIGGQMLDHLIEQAERQVMIGTWKAATWAIAFYEKHGFRLVTEEEKNRLLNKYWTIPERQIETSVVLVQG